MAAENVLQTDPHRASAKNPAEQLADVPLSMSAAATAAAAIHHKKTKPRPLTVTTEKTPLVLKIDTSRRTQSAEEVHPLPWFRSPEWARKSPQQPRGQQKRRRGRGSADNSSSRSQGWWCFGRGGDAARERDVEIGVFHRGAVAADDADGFRQCIQFLVALILVVAIALIFMIVFQPFHDSGGSGGEW